jgi:hypothetical protein
MHGRKVRSSYYSQLGLSNPALSSALDAIFSADVIGSVSLENCC